METLVAIGAARNFVPTLSIEVSTTASISSSPIRQQIPFWIVFVLLIAVRFAFFNDQVDEPHSWRQYDTAQYARSLAEEEFDLFHPKVNWMGGHKALILEFPLPEAVTALLYRSFGADLFWARITTLIFFVGAAVYFRAILRLVATPPVADLSTLIFMMLPLGLPYSRAIHIDPAALFFAHAACFHAISGIRKSDWKHLATASLMGTLAALIKVPYLFYLALPILFDAFRHEKLKSAWKYLPYATPVVALFVLWQRHTHHVNDAAPDWTFIPQYHKFVDMGGWYFSTMEIRFMPKLWETLSQRIQFEVMGGFLGWLPAGIAFCVDWRNPGSNFMRFWTLGTLIYLFIFFPLNIVHNYYQLPFLAPAAFFIAIAYLRLVEEIGKAGQWVKWAAWSFVIILLFGNTFRLVTQKGLKGKEMESFKNYFKVDPAFAAFGKAIQGKNLPKDDLIIASYGGLDCRAPHLLYEAGHYGWSIPTKELNLDLILKLKGNGAKHLAVMDKPNANKSFQASCDSVFQRETVKVEAHDGLPVKEVLIYHLDQPKRP